MRQQLRLRVLLPVAVLGLLGAGFGAYATGRPATPEPLPLPPTGSGATDTGAAETGAAETVPTTTDAAPPTPAPEPQPEKTRLEEALAKHRIVVVVFHTPEADLDATAVREARAGALAAGAGFLAVDVSREGAVAKLALEYEVLEAPTVLVLTRRSGVRSAFGGYVDRDTVAQAVTNARS
jgi:hypothetical protein